MIKKQVLVEQILKLMTDKINLSEQEFGMVQKNFEIMKVSKKTIILHPDTPIEGLYLILDGLLRFFANNEKKTTIRFKSNGEIVGDLVGFLKSKPSEFGIETVENSYIVLLSFEKINWIENNLKEGKKLIRIFYEITLSTILTQDFDLINSDPLKRFDELKDRIPDIEQRVSQKMIATYLNITPAYFSLLKSKAIK
ncbi:MAG: Crp/Fnr family transcriptional regulator [Bacteroidia bacterium]|nr:MAG: Crp/Fnr family transcriptional regulator [Bacteroidia bacterium]